MQTCPSVCSGGTGTVDWSQVSAGVLLVGSGASHAVLEYHLLKARSLHLLQKRVKSLNNAYRIQITLLFHRPLHPV